MAPPVKFDDIAKTATEVLSDDYQTSGFQLKAKQKTSWDGAVLTSAVDLYPPKDSCMTPAKLTWKLPAPLGFKAISIDKFEMDKSGKVKLEASTEKVYKDLKVETKSDLSLDPSKVLVGLTYTGILDTFLKVETKLTSPKDFVAEVTRNVGPATLGAKLSGSALTSPDLGVRLTYGPYFAALVAKDTLKSFTAHAAYKAPCTAPCKIAASYTHGGKASGTGSLGLFYDPNSKTRLKAKVAQDQSISASVKHELSKGFTILAGGRYEVKSSNYTVGLQLSIE